MSEFQKDELSLEETNKLRISLGLKPLVADDAPSSATSKPAEKLDAETEASNNFHQKAEQERRQREDAELKQRLAKAQAKREAARRLKGPTLAEPEASNTGSSSGTDTLQWLKESKKRAKEHAARRAREIMEEESARDQAQYAERDLAGLRVAHEVDDFEEGEERILTLKDSGVLEDEDDQLLDAALDQKEQDKLHADRKKGLKQYSGLDDDEAQTGRKQGVLSKYDVDLPADISMDGGENGFRLGQGVLSSADVKDRLRRQEEEEAKLSHRQLLSLDYTKNQEVSDYLQEGDVGFKKPKAKKRKKATKVKLDLEDDQDAQQDEEMKDDKEISLRPPRREESENFVDDDDLQASLAKARRQRSKKTFSRMTPEMIAQNLAAQKEAEAQEQSTSNGLTFDETSEFVRAIRERPLEVVSRRPASIKSETPTALDIKTEQVDTAADEPMQELVVQHFKTEHTDIEEQDDVDDPITALNEITRSANGVVKAETPESVLEEAEPMVGKGLASTLSFLRNQGMLPQINPELKEREQSQQQYDTWLAARRREEAVREASRQASKASGSSIDQATREAQNRHREIEDARRAQDRFKDYKPDVDIKYHDEFGRDLDQKEAWKHLSHVFHGNTPGTKKTEKRLKKIEDERKREQMAAGDTPTGMMGAFQTRSERTGQAHMVLSIGNRATAPQENDLLGAKAAMQLKKPSNGAKTTKAPKKESTATTDLSPSGGTESLPEATLSVATTKTGGWTKLGSATTNGTSGFAPVSSAVTSEPTPPLGATPFKLSFGTKRKTTSD